MNTTQTTIPTISESNESFSQAGLETYDNLYAKKDYGTLDYPVNARCLDLRKSYMNWIRWHWHEEMEIIIVDQGIAEVSTDDATYLIRPGQGLIINQNVMHCIHAHNKKNCIFHERMLQTLTDIIDLNLHRHFGYEIATKGYLCHFWVELLRQLPHPDTPALSRASQDEQRVKEAMLFIRTHYAESLTLQEIADSIHVSKSECCRCFSRTLQMSPFEYLMKYRIYESTKKLMDSEQDFGSIADLALSVGFNNTSYFNKLFKKFLGCTPTYYRTHKVLHPKTEQGTLSYFL